MKTKTEELPLENATRVNASCPTGGCGGPGLCPGIALMLAYLVGGGVTLLTRLHWLGWAVGLPLALILITGAWRFLPARQVSGTIAADASDPKSRHPRMNKTQTTTALNPNVRNSSEPKFAVRPLDTADSS